MAVRDGRRGRAIDFTEAELITLHLVISKLLKSPGLSSVPATAATKQNLESIQKKLGSVTVVIPSPDPED